MKINRISFIISILIYFTDISYGQNFTNELVRNDFTIPTGFVYDTIGRMYVWEKGGFVYLIDENGIKLPTPLLDISEEVAPWGDHGLTGFALDPNFEQHKYIYLYYVADHHYLMKFGTPDYNPLTTDLYMPTIGRVTRYTLDPATDYQTALLSSRTILLGKTISDGPAFIHESHSTGSIQFGTDGTLLISCGDGNTYVGSNVGGDDLGGYASQAIAEGFMTADADIGNYRSQYLGSYNGKILRIDSETGEGIASNPFYDANKPNSAASRTWVLGLRNPFRFVVKPFSGGLSPAEGSPGILFIGDVGSNLWEELNIATTGGENFGWPITEGGFENPAMANLPTPLNYLAPNQLLGSDNCDQPYLNFRQVFKRPLSDTETPFYHPCNSSLLIHQDIPVFIETPGAISWNHSKSVNFAQTVVPAFNGEGNFIPVEVWTENAPIVSDTFNGFCSIGGLFYDNGPYPDAFHGAYYHADFSGWIRVFYTDELMRITKTDSFSTNCKDILYLAVNPADKQIWYLNVAGEFRKIVYSATPPPVVLLETDKIYGNSPLEVRFDATGSYSPIGYPLSYLWDFGDGNIASEPLVTHAFEDVANAQKSFQIKLTVTDSTGISAHQSTTIYVNNSPPVVNIVGIEDNAKFPSDNSFLLNLSSQVIDIENTPEELLYTWWLIIHHNTHIHPQIVSNKAMDDVVLSPIGCAEDTFWYRILLEVTDPGGLKGSDELLLLPWCEAPFIDFISLAGEGSDLGVSLSWNTGFESSLIGYEVQRSSGNHDFAKIGFVPAAGNGDMGNDYSFLDIFPIRGYSEYRIRALRQIGAFYFSNPIQLNFEPGLGIHVYPNPADQELNLVLLKCVDTKVRFQLYAYTGQLALAREWETTPEGRLYETFDISILPPGVYFYTIRNGYQNVVGKLIKD